MSLFIRMKPWAALLSLLTLQACSQVESSDLRTSAFHANYTVTALSEGYIGVRADYDVGDGIVATQISLSGGDYASASVAGRTKVLAEQADSLIGLIDYTTSFSNLSRSSEERVELNLHRAGEGVYTTPVRIPTGFHIGAPALDSVYSIGNNDVINISWSPFNLPDAMTVTVSADCGANGLARYSSLISGDPGTYQISVRRVMEQVLADPQVNPAGLSCIAELTLERSRRAGATPGLSSNAVGIQKRRVGRLRFRA